MFEAHRCAESCFELRTNLSTDTHTLQCDRVCYKGCEASCLKDYDPLFQFEVGVEGVLFGIGNTVSLLCLAVTVLTFCVFQSLRSVSGLAAMNLALALFLAKLSFLVNPHFTGLSDHWCSAVAVGQHYACLAAFHWVSVLAYDLFLTVKKGRRCDKRTTNGHESAHPKFLTYVLFGWGFPWSAVFACATIEALSAFDFHYGNHEHCGVFGDEALLYSLAIPLTLITTINISFFILIASHPGLARPVGVRKARSYALKDNRILQQIKHSISKKPFVEETTPIRPARSFATAQDGSHGDYVEEIRLLNIYVTKSFLMAIAWLSGFLAAFTHVYGLWIVFIIMNTLQGMFMLKSFVLPKQVRQMWRRKLEELRNMVKNPEKGIKGRKTSERKSDQDKKLVAIIGENLTFSQGSLLDS